MATSTRNGGALPAARTGSAPNVGDIAAGGGCDGCRWGKASDAGTPEGRAGVRVPGTEYRVPGVPSTEFRVARVRAGSVPAGGGYERVKGRKGECVIGVSIVASALVSDPTRNSDGARNELLHACSVYSV